MISYGYDLAGHLTGLSDTSAAITAPVPPSVPSVLFTTTAGYDVLNRPTGISWNPAPVAGVPPSASSVSFAHAYNRANQRISQSASDNSWLNYPPATPSTISYAANALNQYTSVGTVTPSYDANGNLTSDGTFTFGYDAENRLTSAVGAGNTAAYTYDAQGRRKTRTVNGATTLFVTDAANREVLEYDGASGAIQRWYAYGLGANEVLNQMNVVAATRTTLIPDIQGSVIASLDSSSGTLSKIGYLPYGNSASSPSSFGYTGQRIDPETNGLYYYRARHYSPTLGRFLQADPIGYAGGVNLYVYTDNDPLNQTDPSGNCPACVGAVIGGIGGGISGAISGYHSTGTWQGAALGATGGLMVGAAIGAVNPLLVDYAIKAAGGAGAGVASFGAGAITFTAVNAVGGAAGAAAGDYLDYRFAGGSLSDIGKDVRNGALIGATAGLLELPLVALGGAAALGTTAIVDAVLNTQSAIFGTIGTLGTTCSSAGCGPNSENSSAPNTGTGGGTPSK